MTNRSVLGAFLLWLTVAAIPLPAQAKRLSRAEYIRKYSELAIQEMFRTGIPASIKLAQACQESGNGNSYLATHANNHFGIRISSSSAQDKFCLKRDADHCYRKYPGVEESYRDHSDLLLRNPVYKPLFSLEKGDYKGWARVLQQAGYATDPHYADRLIRIIEEHKLYMFDWQDR